MNRAAFTVFLGSADFKYDSKIKQNYRGFTNVKLLSFFFFFSKILLYCGVFLRENGQKIRPISKHLVLLSNVIINSLVFNSSAIW